MAILNSGQKELHRAGFDGKPGGVKAVRQRGQLASASGPRPAVEVCILAGGLSTRMGRDKARLRLGERTMLACVRAAARAAGWRVRVIRRDLLPRCGPLGGVWTAFQRSRASRLMFLSCDMPFVSPELVRAVAEDGRAAVFTRSVEGAGFPFGLDRSLLPRLAQALMERRFSLQAFARRVRAGSVRLPAGRQSELRNLNTPREFQRAKFEFRAKALARRARAE